MPATLKVACDPGEGVFRCRFDVDIEAEDPRRYGVHFDLSATGDVAPNSVECPGAA